MRVHRTGFILFVAVLLAAGLALEKTQPAAAKKCYDNQQNEIPCADLKTPRPRRTEIPPTRTSTPTPTATPTASPTPTATLTATATNTPVPTELAAPPQPPPPNNPVTAPGLPDVLQGIPPWLWAGAGAWSLILIFLFARWFPGRPSINPGPPSLPPGQNSGDSSVPRGLRTQKPPGNPWGKNARGPNGWGTASVLWLLVGASVIGSRILIPWFPVCGIDNFPDLTPTHVDFAKSDFVSVTIANIGPCPARASVGRLDWDTTAEKVKTKAYVWPPADTAWYWNPVPALGSGESTVIKWLWSGSYGKLHDGGLVWGFTVDYNKKIMEEDEYNNTLIFGP